MLFLKVILIILYLIIGACIYSVAHKECPDVQDFVANLLHFRADQRNICVSKRNL
jgi:hypothetical protein|uniref:Uncharacterized protein n=1 Tax=Myoviridae sp. ct78050 TaxID=2826617 RepID=A0A8S5R1Q8_9CAUD|nr:MAG TPA: hypothetical protein [Myoviridae sp. ct78050]